MTDSLKHLRELAEPEMLNKDTMLMPKAAADRWGWLPDKDTMLIKQINLNPFLLIQWLR